MKVVALEHHPNDSRLRMVIDDICQTLSSRMGTGGGNVPLIWVIDDDQDVQETSASDESRRRTGV